MEVVVEVTEEQNLRAVVEVLHDQRFELESLAYAPEEATLRLAFEKEERAQVSQRWYQLLYSRWSVPLVEYIVEVRRVLSLEVTDHARIGSYTFNTLQYDASARELRIVACESLEIEIAVEGLDIAIQTTGIRVGDREIVTVFGCEIS
jgi:hypothetical protein